MTMMFHLTLYLYGCGIRICILIKFFLLKPWYQVFSSETKIHEMDLHGIAERPLLRLFASGIRQLSGQHLEADWLTRANIGTGT
jgi:hypothetical protein